MLVHPKVMVNFGNILLHSGGFRDIALLELSRVYNSSYSLNASFIATKLPSDNCISLNLIFAL